MKRFFIATALLLAPALSSVAAEAPALTELKDKVSYSIGLNIGSNIKRQDFEINAELLSRGILDALQDKTPLLTEEQIQETLQAFQAEMMAKRQAELEQMAQKNLTEGEAFLEENARKTGIKTLASGLQYEVVRAGEGRSPKATDEVTVHYRGTLLDGSEFDSSYGRGEPATFPVGGVIPGWTEALQLMKEGAKWRLFIPSGLAYGERGAGQLIGPNATLIFDVELLSVN